MYFIAFFKILNITKEHFSYKFMWFKFMWFIYYFVKWRISSIFSLQSQHLIKYSKIKGKKLILCYSDILLKSSLIWGKEIWLLVNDYINSIDKDWGGCNFRYFCRADLIFGLNIVNIDVNSRIEGNYTLIFFNWVNNSG